MNFKVSKISNEIKFINDSTGRKFDYIELVNNLYEGQKIVIKNFVNVTEDEKNVINQTIKEINELTDSKKRKRIIKQYEQDI